MVSAITAYCAPCSEEVACLRESFFEIPLELSFHIFSFLSPQDLCKLTLTNRRLALILRDPSFPLYLLHRFFPQLTAVELEVKNRFRTYINHHHIEERKWSDTKNITNEFKIYSEENETPQSKLIQWSTEYEFTTSLQIVRKNNQNLLLKNFTDKFLHLREFHLTSTDMCAFRVVNDLQLIAFFERHTSLTHVTLEGLSKVTEEGLIKALQYCKNLHTVSVFHNGLTDSFLSFLATLPLKSLTLGGKSRFTTVGLKALGTLTNLETVRFLSGETWKSEDLSTFIEKHPNIKELNIFGKKVLNDTALAKIGQKLPKLVTLDITGCECITIAGLTALAQSRSLRFLDMNSCSRELKKSSRDKTLTQFRKQLTSFNLVLTDSLTG